MSRTSSTALSIPNSITANPAPHAGVAPLFMSDRGTARRLNCSRSSIWRAIDSDPTFPRPYRLLGRRIGWRTSEVDEWAAGRERAH
jgi:predicted DNA-binding transcriptional regulator AlpA